ncbi:MAG: MATE family efflux transporter [Pseudomonadota bacterium]
MSIPTPPTTRASAANIARAARPARKTGYDKPRFVTGSLLRHVLVMTGTGALGLMAIFLGDLANIYFLRQLNDEPIIAAVGYGSSIIFLTISIGIGLAIAATALVSPAIGAGKMVRARRLVVHAHILTFTISAVLALVVWLLITPMLELLGATGRTLNLAESYLTILVPALPPLAAGMTSSAILRSVGDARRAMNVTLLGAVTNIVLDPIFIFGLELGIEGAALASALSRITVLAVGLYGVICIHGLMGRPKPKTIIKDVAAFASIAVPAMATNVATPFANAYVTASISTYGDAAVSGWTVIGRIIPVAFGTIYALSGSVGPIVGQNFGAKDKARMRETLTTSYLVALGFAALAWLGLVLFSELIVQEFATSPEAAELIRLFCYWLAPLFGFLGILFVSNAIFNTLQRPYISTALNWGRATLGTIPFVMIGGAWAQAEGVLAASQAGGIVFGALAAVLAYGLIEKLTRDWR